MSQPAIRPRRIIFVNRFCYPDVSATSQMLWDIATRLAGGGAEVHVICSRQLYENARAELPSHECIQCIHIHRVATTKLGRAHLAGRALDYASFYASSALAMFRVGRAGDVLVVKTDPPLLSILGATAAALRGMTLVNWLQDVFPEVATRLAITRLPRWLERMLQAARDRSMRGAAVNIVLGERMLSYFVARGIARDRLRVIENWADGDAVTPRRSEESTLRDRLSLRDHFVVEYSGNLGRAHEIETLLDAAERLRTEPGIVFLMIGGGAHTVRLETLAREKGLTSFRFLGYQPRSELADSLAAADVHLACLLPALEGFVVPSKIYGILAAGRPTVFIGDLEGELAQVLRAGDCGLSVACGDGASLAQALLALRANPMLAQHMGRRARELFESRYTLDSASAKWVALLDELNQGSGRSSVTSSLAQTSDDRKFSSVRR